MLPEPNTWTEAVLEALQIRELRELAHKYGVFISATRPIKRDYVEALMTAKPSVIAIGSTGGTTAGSTSSTPVDPDRKQKTALATQEMKREVHSLFRQNRIAPWLAMSSLLITTYITIWSVAINEVRFSLDRVFPFPVCKWRFPAESQSCIGAPWVQLPRGTVPRTTSANTVDLRKKGLPSDREGETRYKLYFFVIDVSGSIKKHTVQTQQPWMTDTMRQLTHRMGDAFESAEKRVSNSTDQKEKPASLDLALLAARDALKYTQSRPDEDKTSYDQTAALLTAAKLLQLEEATGNSASPAHFMIALMGDKLEPLLLETVTPLGVTQSPLKASGFSPLADGPLESALIHLLSMMAKEGTEHRLDKPYRTAAGVNDTNFEPLWEKIHKIAEYIHPSNHAQMNGHPPIPDLHLVVFSDFDHDVTLRLKRNNKDITKSWIRTRASFKSVCNRGMISLVAVAPDDIKLERSSKYPHAMNMLDEASVLFPKDFYATHRIEEFALATTSPGSPERADKHAIFYHTVAGDVETHVEIPFPSGGTIGMRWFVDSTPLAAGSYSVSQSSLLTNHEFVNMGHLYADQMKPLVFDAGGAAPDLALRLESPPFGGQETLLISSDNLPQPILLTLSCEQIVSESISWVLFLVYILIWVSSAVIMALILGQKTTPKSHLQTSINWSYSFAMAALVGCCLPLPFHANSLLGIAAFALLIGIFTLLFWARHLEDHESKHHAH